MFQSGRAIVQARLENTSKPFAEAEAVTSQLATGGALATGTVGIYDRNGSSTAITRYYDNVQAAIPVTESIVAYANRGIEIRSDGVDRESSAGGTWGRPQRYAGSYFRVAPAGPEDRTTRVVAKASRNNLKTGADDNLRDQITLSATVTPRYVAVRY